MRLLTDRVAMRLVQLVRSDHSNYATYQHKSLLVDIINGFAKTDCELPDGWEKRIDHKTKKVIPFPLPCSLFTVYCSLRLVVCIHAHTCMHTHIYINIHSHTHAHHTPFP